MNTVKKEFSATCHWCHKHLTVPEGTRISSRHGPNILVICGEPKSAHWLSAPKEQVR